MRKNRFLTRLGSGILVAGVSLVLTGGVASAQVPSGTATIIPATGSDATIATLRTSDGCPAGTSDQYNIIIRGPGIFDVPEGTVVTGTQSSDISFTGPFDIGFGISFLDAARDLGGINATVPPGDYTVTAQCVDAFSHVAATFVTKLTFISPTAYWTEAPPVLATQTTVAVAPASPAPLGTSETLTAMVAPPAAAGSVQFMDGSNNIGGPVPVTSGTASTITRLPPGTHPLKAVFTPNDVNAFGSSTSNTVSYVVEDRPGPTATTTTLQVFPSAVPFGGFPAILIGKVSPSGAVGTVQFKDGTTTIGAPVPVTSSFALAITSTLTNGLHPLTAVFTPTDPAAFGSSKSEPVTLPVGPRLF